MKYLFKCLILVASLMLATTAYSNECDQHWGVIAYYARMTNTTLNRVVRFDFGFSEANLVAFELDRELGCQNMFRETFEPIVEHMSVAVNGTFQDDPNGPMVGVNTFVMFTWQHFPWNQTLTTSISLLEGVSYMSGHPQWESRDPAKAINDRRFLNFLGAEVTAALPSDPSWQLVYRIHHRSGVFGVYTHGIVGSTAVGVGLRHTFL